MLGTQAIATLGDTSCCKSTSMSNRPPAQEFPPHRRQGRLLAAGRFRRRRGAGVVAAALVADIAKLHNEGRDVLVVSSGSIALGRSRLKLPRGTLEARGEPGGRRGRADRAGAHLVGGAGRSRHRRRANPGDLAGHRGTPPLSQRALDHRQIAGMARGAGDQRERHGRDHRDPLRRQRSPRRARRHHDERRPPGPALRHRRPLRRAARTGPDAKLIPVVERITPEIEAMAGGAASELSRGGMRTKIEAGQDRHHRRHPHADRVGQDRASAAGHRRWRPLHLVPDARPTPSRRASAGSRARWSRGAR